ncbi:UDP-N-acetylmuramoyl-L-alanyl-D-glutamate--2,6-diaminopimelate ligase [bacterium]|nr:UDP-N-acetylmuramoyl-L-alanyl-D-glutamate--2,6-diaminopimelate ligase [bacterium]
MDLSKLIANIELKNVKNLDQNRVYNVDSITTDSRKITKGTLYIAVRGFQSDGHNFIEDAIKKGANFIVCEEIPEFYEKYPDTVFIEVENSRKESATISSTFFNNPSDSMEIIGITGTNGKTSTTYILESIFSTYGKKVGVIGTIGYKIGAELYPLEHTTPDSLQLSEIFDKMRNFGVEVVLMEVSSHALSLWRAYGVSFSTAIFTNLTQDHLDFHKDMESYYQAKKLLFSQYKKNDKIEIINIDDSYGERLFNELKNETPLNLKSFGVKSGDYIAKNIDLTLSKTVFDIFYQENYILTIETELIGFYNVKNIVGAVSVALEMGISPNIVEKALKDMKRVPGRLESVPNGKNLSVFIDYAHTPDAIENVLSTIKPLTKGKEIVVMGAGGDRDKTKRPLMSLAALPYADLIILTSDNPRTENPESILDYLEEPLKTHSEKYIRISSRKEAIERALLLMTPQDSLVICGKGHENYQIIGTQKHYFSDLDTVKEFLK